MTAARAESQGTNGATVVRTARIVGVDVARCLALLGMMSTHVLPGIDPATGGVPWHQQFAGGRSAALFALLAGVSLALVTGRQSPFRGRQLAAARAGIAVRAVIITLIGLLLGGMESGVAVILAYYGVLFLLALPFLSLGWKPLTVLAGGWAVLGPVLSHLVRPSLPSPTYAVASVEQLMSDPVGLMVELTFTGYYPAVPWLAYVLAGLAVGRLALGTPRVAGLLTITGAALALAAWAVSWSLTHSDTGRAVLERTLPERAPGFGLGLDPALVHGLYGTTPTRSWWWLSISAPHSTTPFDLVHTIGTGLAVLGIALLAGQQLPRLLGIVFAAGAMTLTLYTAHVLALAADLGPQGAPRYWWHAIGALVVGALWRATLEQGPLERLVASASGATSAAVLALGRSPQGRS